MVKEKKEKRIRKIEKIPEIDEKSFMDKVMNKEIKPKNYIEQSDKAIDDWGYAATLDPLHKWLGMTFEEWGDFHAFGKTIPEIVKERNKKKDKKANEAKKSNGDTNVVAKSKAPMVV